MKSPAHNLKPEVQISRNRPSDYKRKWESAIHAPPDVCVRAAAAFCNMMDTFVWEGGFPTITAEQRAMQRRRLEGLGEEPTQEELGDMMWPQRAWWEDRDRIGECQSL